MGLERSFGYAEKRLSAKQIMVLLRQIEVLLSQAKATPRWRRDTVFWNLITRSG
jgi:hypothetical protein